MRKGEPFSGVTESLPTTATQNPRRIRRIVIALLCWAYLLLIIGLIAIIHLKGDRNWIATLLIFSPRWGALLPLPILILLAVWGNRRMLIVLAITTVITVFPFMGFNLGWHRFTSASAGVPIRVVRSTCTITI